MCAHCNRSLSICASGASQQRKLLAGLNENASVVLVSPASTVEANAGGAEELRLRCDAEGSDELEYSWYYNGRQVKRAERIEIKAEHLTVRRPTAADNGIYSCKVSTWLHYDSEMVVGWGVDVFVHLAQPLYY